MVTLIIKIEYARSKLANTPADITIILCIIGLFFKRFGSLGFMLF